MSESLEKNQQQSLLHAPPVYRRFLAGGTDTLRLTLHGIVLIIGIGVSASVYLRLFYAPNEPWAAISSGSASTVAALVSAALAARWLGDRVGMFCGCLYLLSVRILSGSCPPGDHWFAALAATAMAVFALANVAGRLPTVSARWPAGVFYCLLATIYGLFGPAAAVAVLLTCIAVLVFGQNIRGVRFIVDWLGIGFFAALVLGFRHFWGQYASFSRDYLCDQPVSFYGLIAAEIPFDILPWGPLALVAIFVGLRQGFLETPFGKLLTAWILAPLLLSLAGLLGGACAAAMVFAPLVILCGAGLQEILVKIGALRLRVKIAKRSNAGGQR